jgi:hypothetical protein
MVPLASLWLPILLSAVAVFLLSSIIHMATPWHAADYPKVPNEAAVADALRPLGIPPGDYMLPRAASGKEMSTPEFQEKLRRGPVMVLTMLPNGPIAMGKSLGLWFGYSLVVGVFAAYLAGAVLPAGTEYLAVFRVTGTMAFASYVLALWQMTIWYQRSAGTTFRSSVDGLLYALVTGGVFGWLWPAA